MIIKIIKRNKMPGTFSQIYIQVVFAVKGRENLIIKEYSKPPFMNHKVLQWEEILEHAKKMVKEYDIKTYSVNSKARTLSPHAKKRPSSKSP